jgi:hypothetical protein
VSRFTGSKSVSQESLVSLASSLGITERDRMSAALLATESGHHQAALWELKLLRDELETLEIAAVQRARASGLNWAEIGLRLGVTKQAVHKRFSRHEPSGK